MLRTIRDLKAAGRARPSMRYNPFRIIFWWLAKPYFRALLEDIATLRGEVEANRIAILPLSTRLASLEELVAESRGLNSKEDGPSAGQPATTLVPRVMNSAKR